jgi:adenine-specific DNA-methyltransferase
MPILNWLTRETDLQTSLEVPYRLLEPVADLGAGEPSENMVIQGDNLEALKSLLPFYAGKVKCIFIDPPYNTKSAFEHYDDNLEHTQWLAMMYPRIELLRDLLAEDGSIWVSIDDNEAHYLKVIMDEIFGRKNFIANVIWEKSDSPKMDSKLFSSRHDHLVVHSKNIDKFSLHRLLDESGNADHYNRVDDQGRVYYTKPLRAMGSGEDTREARPSMYFSLTAPDGTEIYPKKPDGSDGRWRWGIEKVKAEADKIEWVKGRNGWTAYYRIYADNKAGRPPETIWTHQFSGSNRTSKAEVKVLFGEETTFTTPKPETLIRQILRVATNPGDLVLDSFLGSGTTAAVAHKMGRKYIGIEMGEHCTTLCAPRLKKVIEGEQGGISEAVDWKGGGGFRFYRLGEPVFDENGKINPAIRFAHLASHIWFCETHSALDKPATSPLLGVFNGVAYYLLYNGILGDKRPDSGNVLTNPVLRFLPPFDGPKVIYGESSRLGAEKLKTLGITFKQTPYDIKAR